MNSPAVLLHAYNLLVFACTAGFAAYDLRTRRVPDKALLLFCPVVLAAPFVNALTACLTAEPFMAKGGAACPGIALAAYPTEASGLSLSMFLTALPPALLSSLTGAATGFLILLAAALVSRNGTGIGGGDIKLAAAMGFVYGPARMTAVLLIASGLASIASLMMAIRQKKLKNRQALSLPFVPFLSIGSLAVTLAAIL